MIFVICPGCGHRAQLAKLGRKRLRCSACGCLEARVFKRMSSKLLGLLRVLKSRQPPRQPCNARVETYGGLLAWAVGHEYNTKWAGHKFKALFGRWPDGYKQEPIDPFEELVVWVVQERKRYAAERRKIEGPLRKCKPDEAASPIMAPEDWEVTL